MRSQVPTPGAGRRAAGLVGSVLASPGAAIPQQCRETPKSFLFNNYFHVFQAVTREQPWPRGPTALPCPKLLWVPPVPGPRSPVISSPVNWRGTLSSRGRVGEAPLTAHRRGPRAFPPRTRTAFTTRHGRAHSLAVEESVPLQQPQQRPTAQALPQRLITSSSNYCNSFQLAL